MEQKKISVYFEVTSKTNPDEIFYMEYAVKYTPLNEIDPEPILTESQIQTIVNDIQTVEVFKLYDFNRISSAEFVAKTEASADNDGEVYPVVMPGVFESNLEEL
jgi:hypothetical protein